jgi:TatA/E family protein of Tat protein translocase
MFGTMGVTELVLILVIVLIVFGAGKLPKIGEGLGKALKGFKKEVREAESLPPSPEQAQAVDAQVVAGAPQPVPPPAPSGQPTPQAGPPAPPPVPPQTGPAATPGTTAYMVAQQAWKPVAPPPVAPPAPAGAAGGAPQTAAAAPTQPSGYKAVVNKAAVQRVMAQQAAMKTKNEPPAPVDKQALEAAGMAPGAQAPGIPASKPSAPAGKAPSPQDLQSIGSGLGEALRAFREAASDVRRAVDPSMHTIKAEVEAAQKELQSSIDYVKEGPKVEEPPPK